VIKTPTPPSTRIESIDLLRGSIMLIMALDHVRDYFHRPAYLFDPTDLTQTSPAIFFTRWITHFCAPIFMFLAGVSAYLYGQKKGRPALSFFLLTRGSWLLIAEMLIVTLGWTFNFRYPILILQVIWAFGISMILLSLLVRWPLKAILATGLLLIFGHNLLDGIHVAGNGPAAIGWAMLHEQHFFFLSNNFGFMVGYPLLPWIGLISLGYCTGVFYTSSYDPSKRKRMLLGLGTGAILLFILLRCLNIYGDPHPWSVQKSPLFTFMSVLNVTKYPPSLLYVLMTLGPGLLFLALTERPLNGLASRIVLIGRVPMFFYLVHIYFIHLLALAGAAICGYPLSDMVLHTWVSANEQLRGYGFSLLVVYGVWIGVILLLYPLCKAYEQYKRTNQSRQWWLSYI
jgi:uncharacterized membrane protein